MDSLRLVCFVLVALFFVGCGQTEKINMASNPVLTHGQHPQVFEKTITKTLSCKYLLFLPESYGKKKQDWPILLFLHGLGQSGDDVNKVKVHGPPKIVETQKDFLFILVSPQCPEGKWWPNETEVLINLLDEITSRYDVDTKRVYLTGLSMGGYGTWALAAEYPERFAAIAPICGGGNRILSFRLKDVPVWAFHGAKDRVVPLKQSEEMVNSIKSRGGNAKLTVYPDAGHDCWTKTYNNEELYEWFLKHRKASKAK